MEGSRLTMCIAFSRCNTVPGWEELVASTTIGGGSLEQANGLVNLESCAVVDGGNEQESTIRITKTY